MNLLEPNLNTLREWLAQRGHKPYRAAQIRGWLFEKRAESLADMTDLPKKLREELAAANAGPLSDDGLERLVSELLALTKRELDR